MPRTVLGSDEASFVRTCSKYYNANFQSLLQGLLGSGGYSLQEAFDLACYQLEQPNALTEGEIVSFGFDYSKKDEVPVVEDLVTEVFVGEIEEPVIEKPKRAFGKKKTKRSR